MRGVTFEQLRDSKDAKEFARLLKIRGYYGGTEEKYASLLDSILLRVKVVETYVKYKKPIDYTLVGLVLIGGSYLLYRYIYKK